jgi:hypothetical protein
MDRNKKKDHNLIAILFLCFGISKSISEEKIHREAIQIHNSAFIIGIAFAIFGQTYLMKKILFIAIISAAISIHANAQFHIGLKGGINWASLSGFDGPSRVSGNIGVFLNHRFNSRWSVQPELLYSGEGQQYFQDGVDRTIALGYVEVPVMVQYAATHQLYLEFGPQIGFLTSAEDRGRGNDIINVKGDFTKNQVSIDLGAGVDFTPRFGVFARYNIGLTDVSLFDNIVDHSDVGQLGLRFILK